MQFATLDQLVDQYPDLWHRTLEDWDAILMASKTKDQYWERVAAYFPDYQIFLIGEQGPIGFANTLPFCWDKELYDLPAEGWDWMLKQAVEGYEQGVVPNYLGGLQIVVFPPFRQQGFSRLILQEAKAQLSKKDLSHLFIPIRPTQKNNYPAMSMSEYMLWKENGKIKDPWIRTHLNAGAILLKICPRSMTIAAPETTWEQIKGDSFTSTGYHEIPGALNHVHIDKTQGIGTYKESNIWIYYER